MATSEVAANVMQGDRPGKVATAAPVAILSAAATAVVTGSDVDARAWRSLSYTIVVATQAVKWSVWGANAADFSDEVAVLAATTVAAAGVSSYSIVTPPFAYYRVKTIDDAGGVHGTSTVRALLRG